MCVVLAHRFIPVWNALFMLLGLEAGDPECKAGGQARPVGSARASSQAAWCRGGGVPEVTLAPHVVLRAQ